MAEAPDVSDLAATLRLASDVLVRKSQIAIEIATLRAEDAKLNEVISGWISRVDDTYDQLRGLFSNMPDANQLIDNVIAKQLEGMIEEINEV